jgi:hypothetical protein
VVAPPTLRFAAHYRSPDVVGLISLRTNSYT